MATFSLIDIKHHLVNIVRRADIKAPLGVMAVAFNWVFQEQGYTVGIIFLLVIIDTITGIVKAAKKAQVSSRGFFRFASKLFVYFLMMATGALVDKLVPMAFSLSLINSFLGITEAISIFENIAMAGFAVPGKLLKIMHLFEDRDKD